MYVRRSEGLWIALSLSSPLSSLTSGSKNLKGLQQQQQGMPAIHSRRATRDGGDYASPLGGSAELAVPCVLIALGFVQAGRSTAAAAAVLLQRVAKFNALAGIILVVVRALKKKKSGARSDDSS